MTHKEAFRTAAKNVSNSHDVYRLTYKCYKHVLNDDLINMFTES